MTLFSAVTFFCFFETAEIIRRIGKTFLRRKKISAHHTKKDYTHLNIRFSRPRIQLKVNPQFERIEDKDQKFGHAETFSLFCTHFRMCGHC